jgi:hypothetical protein
MSRISDGAVDGVLHDLGELGDRDALPADADAFLDALPGACLIRRRGRGPGRRAVVGMLHGCEPSGLRAIHALLVRSEPPAVDTLFVIGAVAAARTPPRYRHRMIPGGRDLNRCFAAPFAGAEGAIAAAFLEAVRAFSPDAVVDLHNNSGHNPAYGVATRVDAARLGIVSLFADRYVYATFRLGSLMEALADELPIVTIECGRAGDPAADEVARRGLVRFLDAAALPRLPVGGPGLQMLGGIIRVCLAASLTLAFDGRPHPEAHLTFDVDVDRHNFQPLAAGSALGWVRAGSPWPLSAHDADGREVSRDWFAVHDGAQVTRRPLMPIMMTTNPRIAVEDCLFYVVRPLADHTPSALAST